MGYTIAQKIIKEHLVSGEMTVGSDIGLKIDQTLAFRALKQKRAWLTLTTTHYRQALRMPTTTDLFSRSAKSTVFIFHVPVTVFATRFTLNASASPARP